MSDVPMLQCSVCHAPTKGTELAMFGARCGRCYGAYPRETPEKRQQRQILDKPAAQALANINEAAARRELTPGQLWVKQCCERMV